jgi:glycine/D-amino acid oxidase-like deaminating enzyme
LTDNTTQGKFPTQAQVVIIGGGVIGCSVAYHLTKLGWQDVLLLERSQLTSGTTWHAAGLIVSGGFGTETTINMAKYTRELYTRLGEETGQDTGFSPVGYLEVASTYAGRQILPAGMASMLNKSPPQKSRNCGRSCIPMTSWQDSSTR